MDNTINAQAAVPPISENAPDDVTNVNKVKEKYTIPLLFLRESEIFGERKPDKTEWVQHIELFRAIGQRINVSHITGLQRVRGLWRIYLDNIEDKVTLMAEGVPLRGKILPVLNTNPDRFDGEQTVRVRVKNIPLSVDDGIIKRIITLKEAEVISMYRERLRVDSKLTNCETGDRILIVKESSLKEPLPFSMSFGQFVGRVIHPGQQKPVKAGQKCSKCLQDGHTFGSCTNEWVCTICNGSGHKRIDCPKENKSDSEDDAPETSDSDSSSSETSDNEGQNEKKKNEKKKNEKSAKGSDDQTADQTPRHKKEKKQKQSEKKTQQLIDRYVTPGKNRPVNGLERSPPTPTEELHDKHAADKNNKKQKK